MTVSWYKIFKTGTKGACEDARGCKGQKIAERNILKKVTVLTFAK